MGNSDSGPTVYTATDAAYTTFFTQQCDAFNLVVLANATVPEDKVKYVCSIALEYLDNDEDGEVDSGFVNEEMKPLSILIFESRTWGIDALNQNTEATGKLNAKRPDQLILGANDIYVGGNVGFTR